MIHTCPTLFNCCSSWYLPIFLLEHVSAGRAAYSSSSEHSLNLDLVAHLHSTLPNPQNSGLGNAYVHLVWTLYIKTCLYLGTSWHHDGLEQMIFWTFSAFIMVLTVTPGPCHAAQISTLCLRLGSLAAQPHFISTNWNDVLRLLPLTVYQIVPTTLKYICFRNHP